MIPLKFVNGWIRTTKTNFAIFCRNSRKSGEHSWNCHRKIVMYVSQKWICWPKHRTLTKTLDAFLPKLCRDLSGAIVCNSIQILSNLVDVEKCWKMRRLSLSETSIQPQTSRFNFQSAIWFSSWFSYPIPTGRPPQWRRRPARSAPCRTGTVTCKD